MRFINKKQLPETVRRIVERGDYICYVRVYYCDGRYSSRLFFNGAANGTVEEIERAAEKGKRRYTEELKSALQTICEELFEGNNPGGRYELYDFCEKNQFDRTDDGYTGYCYLAHSAAKIVVSKSDDYFARVYLFDRENG